MILYDQLGCGNSEKPGFSYPYSLEDYVNELDELIHLLLPGPVHLLGQSWGTMLAVEYLLTKDPNHVKSLVLSSPCLSVSRWDADQKRNLQALPDFVREAVERHETAGTFDSPEYLNAMDMFYHTFVCRLDPWPDPLLQTMEKMSADVYTLMWGPSEFTITGSLRSFERVDDLHQIHTPTLITCGEFDEASPDTCRYYLDKIPGSELVLFPGASHEHHLEQTPQYLASVAEFLNSTE